MKKIALLMITHNRLEYTWRSISQLLRINQIFDLSIVDNASSDQTRQYLNKLKDTRVKTEYLSRPESLSSITNRFWQRYSQYDFIGKVDNDTLVSDNWLAQCLGICETSNQVAAAGGFAFDIYKDWNFEKSKRNVRDLGSGCKVLVQPIIGGCAYITRPQIIRDVGLLDENIKMSIIYKDGERRVALSNDKTTIGTDIINEKSEKTIIHGWTDWQAKAREKGYIVCYPFPLVVVEHMDDPLSLHCQLDKDPSATEVARKNAKQRGMEYSRQIISDWIRKDGKYLFTEYVYTGSVGRPIY